jgi:hypothetical protein
MKDSRQPEWEGFELALRWRYASIEQGRASLNKETDDSLPTEHHASPACAVQVYFGLVVVSLALIMAREDNPECAPFAALRFKFQAGVEELAGFLDDR